jgi:hypothetical protein
MIAPADNLVEIKVEEENVNLLGPSDQESSSTATINAKDS